MQGSAKLAVLGLGGVTGLELFVKPTEKKRKREYPVLLRTFICHQSRGFLHCLYISCNMDLTEKREFDIGAYQRRYVALEVFYSGWKYHGFASQADTQETVEVSLPTNMQGPEAARTRQRTYI